MGSPIGLAGFPEHRQYTGFRCAKQPVRYNPNTLRLETLKAGTASPFENLQKLTYAYDPAGNVRT